MQVNHQLVDKSAHFSSALRQLVSDLASAPEKLRGLFSSANPSSAELMSGACSLLQSHIASPKLKESAINAVVAGIVAGSLAPAKFYDLFKASLGDPERAMQFAILCKSMREGNLAQGLVQEVFFAAAATDRDQVTNVVSRYVLDGYPGFTEWYSVASTLQRTDDACPSILGQLLSQDNRSVAARAAGIVSDTLTRIDKGITYESARLLLASSFLKCRGLVVREDRRIDNAIDSCMKTLLFSVGAHDTFSAILHGAILASNVEVALALIKFGVRSGPEAMARILCMPLDRRTLAHARGYSEDLEGSQMIAMAAGHFFIANNSVGPVECFQFLQNNRELVTSEVATSLEGKVGTLLCYSRDPKLVPFIDAIRGAAPASLLPAIANYLGRFGHEEKHLKWLLENATSATNDAAGYIDSVAAVSSRFLSSRDPSRVRSARDAIKRLRAIGRSRKSYRKLKRAGGVRSLNRALESIDSAPSIKSFWDFVVRSTVGIIR